MINSKDILTRLQNGESAEAIANELIGALNDANAAYEAEVAAKRVEDEVKAKRNAKKITDMQDILDLMHDFCIEYYCDSNEDINAVEEAFSELTAEKVIDMVEEAGATILKFEEHLKDVEKLFGNSPFGLGNLPKPTVEVKIDKNATPADADTVISGFLKSIGLK